MYISSKDNKSYKLCQSLLLKKNRDTSGLYLIEGPNLVFEALTNKKNLSMVIIKDGKENNYMQKVECIPNVHIMEQGLFDRISDTQNSQGILGVVKKEALSNQEFIEKIPEGKNIIVFDRLQDPGNIGTIIRTAEGAGYMGVIALKGTGDIYSPKAIRAASGSVFRMPVLLLDSPAELIPFVREMGKKIVATSIDAEKNFYNVDLKKDVALVIGNEGSGISPLLASQADLKIKIPMKGKVESLNAAIAAGIIMYEAMDK